VKGAPWPCRARQPARQKSQGDLSTHLNLLKSYAFLNERVENAAVAFDAAP
jgi:dsDNA-specific endonuclease/ATPase MutS2